MPKFLTTLNDIALKNVTLTGLFALSVMVMIFGHFVYFFIPYETHLRIPDRILAPVFLIAVGYNSAHKMSPLLYIGAIILFLLEYFTMGQTHVTFIGTIVILKLIIEPIGRMMSTSIETMIGFSAALIVAYIFTAHLIEYSTIAIILAFAGWYLKNYKTLDKAPLHPALYFAFAFGVYMWLVQFHFSFTPPLFLLISICCAVTFYYLYNIKTLLLNAIKKKRSNIVAKTISFIGHKSLEIYIFHMFAFYIIAYLIKR